jgi:hypothetical protein
MGMKPWMPCEPVPYRSGLVRAVVVNDLMNVERHRHSGNNSAQKLHKRLGTVATVKLANSGVVEHACKKER